MTLMNGNIFDVLPSTSVTGMIACVATFFLIYSIVKTISKGLLMTEIKPPIDGIPMLPGAHRFYGHLLNEKLTLSDSPSQSITHLKKHSRNGMTSLLFGPRALVLLLDTELASSFLNSYTHRAMPNFIGKHMAPLFGAKNILMINGKEWRLYRSAVHRSFTSKSLQNYQVHMLQISQTMVNSLRRKINDSEEKSTKRNVVELMKMVTMDVFFMVSVGMDLKSCELLQVSEVAKDFTFISNEFVKRVFVAPFLPWNQFFYVPTVSNFKRHRAISSLRSTIKFHIQEKKREKKDNDNSVKGTKSRNCMLYNLMQAQDRDLEGMNEDDFVGSMLTLLNAGYETTSTTLSYALYLISTRPDIEQYLVEEARRVMSSKSLLDEKDDNSTVGFDVSDLNLCNAVIYETLRLYPVAYQTARTIPKGSSIELKGIEIPGPTIIRIPIYAIQRDEDNFPQPEEFLPERWARKSSNNSEWVPRFSTDGSVEEKAWASLIGVPPANRNAFYAFSSGARSCVGKKFAEQEAVIILANLISQLKFEVEKDYVCIPYRSGVVQSPKNGLPMNISVR